MSEAIGLFAFSAVFSTGKLVACRNSQPDRPSSASRSLIALNVILNAMTKVQLTFKLSRSLTETDMVNIGRMHSVYGFFVVRPTAGETELFVEFDASRLSPKEVRGSLEEHGLPLANPPAPQAPATEASLAS